MARRLPPTITADKSPDWLPAGWIAQSAMLKSGREIRSYTQLKTGKKFSTKDHVLQYAEMEKVREERYSKHMLTTNEHLEWLPENWIMEHVEHPRWLPKNWIMEEKARRKGACMGTYKVYVDLSTRRRFFSKVEVLRHLRTLTCEALEKTWEGAGIDEYNSCQRMITYPGYEEHEDLSKNQEEPNTSSPSTIEIPKRFPNNWTVEAKIPGNRFTRGNANKYQHNVHPEWLPKNWTMVEKTRRTGALKGKTYKVYKGPSSSRRFFSKVEVLRHLETLKCEASMKTWEAGIDEYNDSCQRMITYPRYEEHEDFSENQEEPSTSSASLGDETYKHPGQLPAKWKMEVETRKMGLTRGKRNKPPSPRAKRRKLKSPATRRRLFADGETISPSDNVLVKIEASTEEDQDKRDSSEGALAVSPLAIVFPAEEDLHDVVVESADQIKKSNLASSSGFEVKLECEPVSVSTHFGTDISPEKNLNESAVEEIGTRNVELTSNGSMNDKESNLTCGSDLAKDGVTEKSGYKSQAPLKVQDLHEEQLHPEETINKSRQFLFFPFRDTSSDADHLRTSSMTTATLSVEDLSNSDGLASTRIDIIREKNICGSKMQKKTTKTFSSQRIKKKVPETPCKSTEQLEKPETPSKTQGERSDRTTSNKSSMSIAIDQNECPTPYRLMNEAYHQCDFAHHDPLRTGTGSSTNSKRPARQQTDFWPDLCPDFSFAHPPPVEDDDSAIRRYLEQHYAVGGTADSNFLQPDFGLPSLSQIKLSPDEADEQRAVAKQSYPDPPCVKPMSSPDPPCLKPKNPSLASSSFFGPSAEN